MTRLFLVAQALLGLCPGALGAWTRRFIKQFSFHTFYTEVIWQLQPHRYYGLSVKTSENVYKKVDSIDSATDVSHLRIC